MRRKTCRRPTRCVSVARMIPLESSRIFSQLPPPQLAAIKQAMEERAFTSGQPIFQEGDAGDGIYLINSGEVEISVVVGSGN